jgi:hypothetical protein
MSLDTLMARHRANHAFDYPVGFLEKRVEEIIALVPEDLLKRPVHVSIVAELGSNPDFNFEGFNEYLLYEHFIREMVERDGKKKARQGVPIEDRLKFQRELAWWSWSRLHAAQGFFLRRDIPKTLIEGLSDGRSADDEGKLNEYIVSSLTEEKQAGALFFAHRSFQEFLVAERARLAPLSPRTLEEYSTFLTDDVLRYLRHSPDENFAIDWYEMLRDGEGPFSGTLLAFLAGYPHIVTWAAKSLKERPETIDAWSMLILAHGHRLGTEHSLPRDELTRLAQQVAKNGSPQAAAAATLTLIDLYRSQSSPLLLTLILGALIERVLGRSRELLRMSLTVNSELMDFASRWLHKHVSKVFPTDGQTRSVTLECDLSRLEEMCALQLSGGSSGSHPLRESAFGVTQPSREQQPVSLDAQKVFDTLGKKMREEYSAFLYARTVSFHLTEVKTTRPRVSSLGSGDVRRRADR